jgi:hypothetical protein
MPWHDNTTCMPVRTVGASAIFPAYTPAITPNIWRVASERVSLPLR